LKSSTSILAIILYSYLSIEELGARLVAVYINDNIACSPMITNAQVHRIAEEFNLVVSLAEVHELKYSPKKFSELGVE